MGGCAETRVVRVERSVDRPLFVASLLVKFALPRVRARLPAVVSIIADPTARGGRILRGQSLVRVCPTPGVCTEAQGANPGRRREWSPRVAKARQKAYKSMNSRPSVAVVPGLR